MYSSQYTRSTHLGERSGILTRRRSPLYRRYSFVRAVFISGVRSRYQVYPTSIAQCCLSDSTFFLFLFKPHKYIRRYGQPGQTLCDVAKEENVDMVVVGTRGRGKIRRTLLGSVSDYVLHHSQVPVAICRQ